MDQKAKPQNGFFSYFRNSELDRNNIILMRAFFPPRLSQMLQANAQLDQIKIPNTGPFNQFSEVWGSS